MHTIIKSCALLLWLHTLTFVKSQDCALQQFLDDPSLYDSNFDISGLQASYPGGKQVRVGCSVGYSGFYKLICVEGKWQSRGSRCQPKSCGHPGDAEFADFQLQKGDDFVFGSQVLYTCYPGYQMVSRTNIRRCMADGWDGNLPVCEAQLCPVIHVADNVQVYGDTEEATYGKVVRFSCKSSTEILKGAPEIFCNENNEWNEEPPTCKEITCGRPAILNGFVRGNIEEYREHQVLDYGCNAQYKRSEERSTKCVKVGSRAEWSPTPLCEYATCKVKVPPLVGTRYEPSGKSVFSPGDRVRVICGEKYFIFNRQTASAEILCNDIGSWEHRPLCEEITCSRPDSQLLDYWGGGWYLKRAGDTATYRCISGYKSTNGVDRATCARDGWTPNPFCQEITCMTQDYPNAIIGGIIKPVYKYNDQVRFICKNDHTRYFTLTCTDKGLWRGSVHCPDISCSKPVIKDVDIIENDRRESFRHGERVACRCNHGARESFTVTCDQGKWTGIKSCSGCGELSVEHGFGVHPNATVPLAYYTCDEGYKLFTKGWWAEAKCNDGEWSKLDQCIEQSQCGEEPVIPNGKATRRETRQGPVQTLQIDCDAGYSASIAQLRCQEGQWNLELPPEEICKRNPDLCGPPPKVENAVVSTPYQKEYLSTSQVTYQCRDQHRIQGEDKIRCRDGEWERKNIKCIPFCGKLKDKMKTMTFSKSKERYVTGEVINYRCVVPEPIAQGTATCENGTWIKTVECKVKPCPTPNNINGGRHAIIKGKGYVYGTAVKYTCNEGYRMKGQHTLKCTLDGWDKIEPRCERVTCQVGSVTPGFAAPRAGETVTAGESLVFSCRDNYDLEGDGEVVCLGTGEWSGPFPTCSKKCQVQNVPSTVNYTPRVPTLSKGQTLTFSCKNQQHLIQGSSTAECLENGEWSKTFPSCGASSHCGRPPSLEGGDTEEATRDQYNRNNKVKYVCQRYYTMEGGPYKTCINGEWTGDIRCLEPCTVDKDAMTRHNIRFKYSYQDKLYSTHNDEIEFTCSSGRHVGRVGMRQRCLHGVIELPTCE